MEQGFVRVLSVLLLMGWATIAAASPVSSSANPAGQTSVVPQRYGVFDEGLVPFGTPGAAENAALSAAIARYRSAGNPLQTTALDHFLNSYPRSAWRVSLLTNEGLAFAHAGEFSKALNRLEAAWRAGRNAHSREQRALVDRAVGELLHLDAAFGHKEAVKSLLAQVKGRILIGDARVDKTTAEEALWDMQHGPANTYVCGLVALGQLMLKEGDTAHLAQLKTVHAGPGGISLARLTKVSQRLGLHTRMVFRKPGQPIPVPAVVHWKVGHYATIVAESAGRYHVKDAAMGRDFWMSREAVQNESSGYFLVPVRDANGPWRRVAASEARQIIGAGITPGNNPTATSNDDPNVCNCTSAKKKKKNSNAQADGTNGNSAGMAQYSVKAMLVSLSLHDTPVSYTPPKGPAVPVTIVYSQREANQPANFTFFNLGHKWTTNWLSYVQDNPNAPGSNVMVYLRGGGSRYYTGYNASTGAFAPEERTRAHLVEVSKSPVVYERRMPDGSKQVYGASDGSAYYPRRIFLTKVVDPSGNAVSLSYDAQMRLTTLKDALGQQTTFHYDDASYPLQITSATDPFGRTASIAYDSSGRLTSITDVLGMQSQFGYGNGTFISSLTTPYGTTRFAGGQHETERWLEITDPKGQKERVEFRHNAPGIPFSTYPVPQGIGTFNEYINSRNTFFWDKTAMQRAPGDYRQAVIYHWLHEESFVYRGLTAGTLESVKRPLERRIWYNYPNQPWAGGTGGFDKPSIIARVLGDGSTQLRRFSYNAFGRVTRAIDPRGREVDLTYAANGIDLIKVARKTGSGADVLAQFTYNDQHKPLTYTDAAGQTTTYAYNGAGQRTSMTDPLGETTAYSYDSNGYLLSVTDANGKTLRSYTYDGFGRVASITDSEGYTRQFSYDALNRLTAVTYPDGTRRTITWDKLDPVAVTDREGRTTKYGYDSVRDLVSKTDPLGEETQYGYYANGKLKSLSDPDGNVTAWDRDIEGRVTARTYADGSRETYAYDATGRLKSRTDALGQVTDYAYSRDDHVMGISYANAQVPTPSVSFGYGTYYPRVTSRTDGQGVTDYSYYPAGVPGAGKLESVQGSDSHDSVQYSYDALGRVANRTVDGAQQTFSYDALGRPVGETNPLGSVTTAYLGETNQPTMRSIANVPYQITYQYEDNLNDRRLKAILNDTTVNGGTQPVMDYSFTTSPVDLILSRTANDGSALNGHRHHGWHKGLHKGWDHAPHWGVLAQLFGNTDPDDSHKSPKGQASGHDDDRGREDHEGGLPGEGHGAHGGTQGITTQYTYDDALRLTVAQGGNTESYTYDPAGNITQLDSATSTAFTVNDLNQVQTAGATSYTYDADGNLLDDGINTYVWDAAGRLVKVTNKQSGHTSQFTYDGLSRRVSDTETDSGGSPVTTKFLWCGLRMCEKRDASDAVLARYYRQGELQNGQPLFYARDQVGSVVAVVDGSGTVVGRLSYDSYGNITSSSGTLPDFRYAGLYYHAGSGLYLAVYRVYDPTTARWTSRDPIRELGGINLYAYVFSDPINGIDPTGLFCFNFDKFANQVDQNRASNALTLGSLITDLGVGTMPKTPAELRGLGVPKAELNPYTSQLSRWSGRLGTRALRVAGRTTAGVVAGAIATGAVIFEGFYDWGVIGKAAWDASSSDDCGCQK